MLLITLHRGTSLVGRAIRWQTRSAYSHAALVCPATGHLVEAREGRGVVEERHVLQLADPFDVLSFPCTPAERDAVLAFARAQLGKGYDYWSVLRFITRQQARRKDSGKWFCSELVHAAVAEGAGQELVRVHGEHWRVAPGHLYLSPFLRLVDQSEALAHYLGTTREPRQVA